MKKIYHKHSSLSHKHNNYFTFTSREDVESFAKTFSETHQKNYDDILAILLKAKKQQSILDAIARPAEKTLTWGEYRKIFIEPKRL